MVRRFYKRRIYRHRKPWSSNFSEGELSTNVAGLTSAVGTAKLCENPAQTAAGVSQPFTVSRLQLNLQAFISTAFQQNDAALERIQVGVFYVPQNVTVNADLFVAHPEWLIAYKYIGLPSKTTSGILVPATSIRSRLKRTLQTGDSLWMVITLVNSAAAGPIPIRFTYSLRWWTRAN